MKNTISTLMLALISWFGAANAEVIEEQEPNSSRLMAARVKEMFAGLFGYPYQSN